jgi:zinc transporter 9
MESKHEHHGHNIGKKSVIIALLGNTTVGILKFISFFATGSAVMLSEGIHSIADSTNQMFLLIGIVRAQKPADEKFNYGYLTERFFWSLLSACGVFFVGAGVTIYHGIDTLKHPAEIHLDIWTILILIAGIILEGFALLSAVKEMKKLAGKEKFWKFAKHSGDPTLLAIIYEDSAAIMGILIAGSSIALSIYTGNHYWDSIGSITVGVLLGFVAIALMNANRELLLGKAIPRHIQKKIYTILLNQKIVDEVHDFKTVMITTDGYRVKAEVEVNGHVLAEKIFASRDFKQEYDSIKDYKDFVKFCAGFSDEVTRTLGKEIDALEEEIEDEIPTVKHIDIEAN